jgi:hypothetical protein
MDERRKELRIALMAKVEAVWQDETGTPHVSPASMQDWSPGGASIRIGIPIGVGAKLTIKSKREEFSGTVTYSRRDKKAYILGIQRDAAANNFTKDKYSA